jgi:hypothetical protein
MNDTVNTFQSPTEVLFFSQSKSLGESIAFSLAHTRRVKTFSEAKLLIDWVDNHSDQITPFHIRPVAEMPGPDRYFSANTNRIYHRVFDRHRFSAPAVIVIGMDVDAETTLQLCRQLSVFSIKKILLIDKFRDFDLMYAFNEKLIDHCLLGSGQTDFRELEIAIKNMELQYFREQSGFSQEILTKAGISYLTDDAFVDLIESLISENAFVEQYWFDCPNGILFVDCDGNCKLMVIETEVSMFAHLDNAQDAGAPMDLLEALRNFRMIPFFFEGDGNFSALHANWQSYCRPAQLCNARQKLFWALFDLPEKYRPNEIYSFNEHLQSAETAF